MNDRLAVVLSFEETEKLILRVLTLNESLGEDKAGNKALVYRACFTYLPAALHTPRPVLYLANKCAITCNRKYCSVGLFPAIESV